MSFQIRSKAQRSQTSFRTSRVLLSGQLLEDKNKLCKKIHEKSDSRQQILTLHLWTASINLARMTDSMCDSASMSKWFKHLFHAPKPPSVLVCLRRRTPALWSKRDVRYCSKKKGKTKNIYCLNCREFIYNEKGEHFCVYVFFEVSLLHIKVLRSSDQINIYMPSLTQS